MLERTRLLLTDEQITKLTASKVAVFGVGGVGSAVVEALVRAGVGKFVIVDNDQVSLSNINRQIIALHSTIGLNKVDVIEQRMKDINPSVKIKKYDLFFDEKTKDEIDFSDIDYIVDAIDTVPSKILLIVKALSLNKKIISSMGTGNKLIADFIITDISKTEVCPLAKKVRLELRKLGINRLNVCYSKESPINPYKETNDEVKKKVPGSISYVPPMAGLKIASKVITDLIYGI